MKHGTPYHIGLNFPGLHFEAPELAAPVEAEVEPALGEGVAATAPPEGAEAPPAASAWAPSEEEWFQTQQALQGLAQYVNELGAPPETQPGEWDPLSDNAGEDLLGRIEQMIDQRLTRVNGMVARQEHEHASATRDQIFDSFNDLGVPNPETGALEFDRDMAHALANASFAEMEARYNGHPYAIQAALRQGAERAVEYAKQQREIGKQAYIDEMKKLQAAPQTPPGNQATGTEVTPQIDDPMRLADYKSRRFLEGIAS